jgi:hypothetical protein
MSGTLKSKKPLLSKTNLEAKKPLAKRSAKPKKQKVQTITALRRKADKLFGHYIRLRDAEYYGIHWVSQCISCGRENIVRWYDENDQKWHWGRKEEVGHFIGRGNYHLRYDEINCNSQDVFCNKYKNGNIVGYEQGLEEKYGRGTAQALRDEAQAHPKDPLKREDLEQVIKTCKEYLDWVYEQERIN